MTWKIKGSRVYGFGQSINCTNKVSAQQLYDTLTYYENSSQTDQLLKNINDQLTQIQLTLQELVK